MSANGDGTYYSTRENSMRAFDQLPKAARQCLANTALDWAPQPILTAYRKGVDGFMTGEDIAATVRQCDQENLAKLERRRARAIGAYQGNTPDNISEAAKRLKRDQRWRRLKDAVDEFHLKGNSHDQA